MIRRAFHLLLIAVFALTLAPAVVAQTGGKKPAPPAAAKPQLLDINTAPKADLVAMPAIGDAYAQKIIDGRPYKRKDELVSRNIIPASAYAKIKDKIIASQTKK
jgi:DNA uptake protein ComE-like DNA-binding protein